MAILNDFTSSLRLRASGLRAFIRCELATATTEAAVLLVAVFAVVALSASMLGRHAMSSFDVASLGLGASQQQAVAVIAEPELRVDDRQLDRVGLAFGGIAAVFLVIRKVV